MTTELIFAFGMLLFCLVVFTVVIVFDIKERRELLDRLMAKNFTEYKDNIKLEDNDFGSDDPNLISLEDAKEEINGQKAK